MNIFQKIGAYEYCAQNNIPSDEFDRKLAGAAAELIESAPAAFDALTNKVAPFADDILMMTMRNFNKGNKKDDKPTLDKVAAKDDAVYHGMRAGILSSILAGNLAGAMYFALKRNALEEDTTNEALKKRIGLYHDISRQLSSQFNTAGTDNSAAATGPVATPGPSTGNG
jgi:hypothetical protein